MKDWLESWKAVLTIIAVVVGGTVWVTSSIADLRLEIPILETRMENRLGGVESRLSAVEAKLDLLIEGLDVTVRPKSAGAT